MNTTLTKHFAQHIITVVAVLLFLVVFTPLTITATIIAPVACITSLTITLFSMSKMALELYVQRIVREANAAKG